MSASSSSNTKNATKTFMPVTKEERTHTDADADEKKN
jgi:hypothetical protein